MEREFLKYQVQLQTILEPRVIKAVGIKIKCKDMECTSMHVEPLIKVYGKITNIMEKEYINLQMEQFMKANGKIIKCMEQASTLILMVENGKDNIEMVNFKLKNKRNCFTKNKYKLEKMKRKKLYKVL